MGLGTSYSQACWCLLDHIPTRDRPCRVRLLGGPVQAGPPGPDDGRHGELLGLLGYAATTQVARKPQAGPAPERGEHTGLPASGPSHRPENPWQDTF